MSAPTSEETIKAALAWLAEHPHSSTLQIAAGIGSADARLVEGLLKAAWRARKVDGYTEGHVWLWEVTP